MTGEHARHIPYRLKPDRVDRQYGDRSPAVIFENGIDNDIPIHTSESTLLRPCRDSGASPTDQVPLPPPALVPHPLVFGR